MNRKRTCGITQCPPRQLNPGGRWSSKNAYDQGHGIPLPVPAMLTCVTWRQTGSFCCAAFCYAATLQELQAQHVPVHKPKSTHVPAFNALYCISDVFAVALSGIQHYTVDGIQLESVLQHPRTIRAWYSPATHSKTLACTSVTASYDLLLM